MCIRDSYKDMDKSKARIYDDLMARHWDYWDEGEYLSLIHISFSCPMLTNAAFSPGMILRTFPR